MLFRRDACTWIVRQREDGYSDGGRVGTILRSWGVGVCWGGSSGSDIFLYDSSIGRKGGEGCMRLLYRR